MVQVIIFWCNSKPEIVKGVSYNYDQGKEEGEGLLLGT